MFREAVLKGRSRFYFIALYSVILIVMSQALRSQAQAFFFTDLDGHFSASSADALNRECNVTGYRNSKGDLLHIFKPNAPITRAELVALLIACQFEGEYTIADSNPPFADISTQWFARPLSKAKELGWVVGYGDGSFRPTSLINRAEALTTITRAKFSLSEIQRESQSTPFADVKAGDWFAPFTNFAFQKQLIKGYQELIGGSALAYFRPANNITRGEAAVIIAKTFQFELRQPPSSIPTIGACTIFPADNPWNTDISKYPIHPESGKYITQILNEGPLFLHADFGSNMEYGIPYNVVSGAEPKVPIEVVDYPDESDIAPFPIPFSPRIEGGTDNHMLIVDQDNCLLYELFAARYNNQKKLWQASSSAIFDLKSNKLRPDYWTSTDAAGLPVFAGLARYDEIAAGAITHALRFSVSETQKGFIHPATHFAPSSEHPFAPPMGLRLRMRSDYDISEYTGQSQIILKALKKYGMIVADNGSDWFISGASDPRWDDEDLNQLKTIPGTAFEAVNTGPIVK